MDGGRALLVFATNPHSGASIPYAKFLVMLSLDNYLVLPLLLVTTHFVVAFYGYGLHCPNNPQAASDCCCPAGHLCWFDGLEWWCVEPGYKSCRSCFYACCSSCDSRACPQNDWYNATPKCSNGSMCQADQLCSVKSDECYPKVNSLSLDVGHYSHREHAGGGPVRQVPGLRAGLELRPEWVSRRLWR